MGVGLDDIFDKSKEPKVGEASGTLGLTVTKSTKTKSKEKQETSQAAVMDEYKMLMFAVDKSGSMLDSVASNDPVDYEWPENLLEHIKRCLLPSDRELSEEDDALMQSLQVLSLDDLK